MAGPPGAQEGQGQAPAAGANESVDAGPPGGGEAFGEAAAVAAPAPVADDESIYRRIAGRPSMVTVDTVTGEERPSSGAFLPDEEGVSVYRVTILEELGLTWRDVVKTQLNRNVELDVHEVRALPPLEVEPDPWPQEIDEPDHARNAAHALITGWAELPWNQRTRLARKLAQAASFVGGNIAPDAPALPAPNIQPDP